MRKLTSLVLCTLLFCSFISCTQSNKDINTANQEQKTMETVEAGDVVFENIDNIIGGRYRTVANDETMILEKKIYPSYSSISYHEFFQLSDIKTEYYQYDGINLTQIDDMYQYDNEKGYVTPFYINPSNEICYSTGNGLMVIEKNTDNSFTSLNLDFGSMIYKGKYLPWVLFYNEDLIGYECTLYNLDDHMKYTFTLKDTSSKIERIREFYKYDDTIIFAIDDVINPWAFHYDVYSIEELLDSSNGWNTSEDKYIIATSEDDAGNTSHLVLHRVSHLSLIQDDFLKEEISKAIFDGFSKEDAGETFLDGNKIIDSFVSTPFDPTLQMAFNIDITYFNKDTSELVWMPYEKNQINISDVNTGEVKETILSDEIISQVFSFDTDDKQGLWFIPSLTSIGATNHIYLLTWQNNVPVLQTYNIGNYFFNNNAFVDENGMLYVISTDLTSGTQKFNLLLVDPNNDKKLYKYLVVSSDNFLEKETSSFQFTKLQSMPGQIIIQTKANTSYHRFDEHIANIYKVQFEK